MTRHGHSIVGMALLAILLAAGTAGALPDEVDKEVQRLYSDILSSRSSAAKAAAARSQIRVILEKHFGKIGIPLPSYALPLGPGRWKVTQGNSTKWSHKNTNQFSWDFELVDKRGNLTPKGNDHHKYAKESYSYRKPIKAARNARRAWVSSKGVELAEPSNIIVLQHGDHTRSIYDHVAVGGLEVNTGDNAAEKQTIGYIGATGTGYPHLHFSVRVDRRDEWPDSKDNWTLPIRFSRYWVYDPGTQRVREVQDGVPLEGQIIAISEEEAKMPSVP